MMWALKRRGFSDQRIADLVFGGRVGSQSTPLVIEHQAGVQTC